MYTRPRYFLPIAIGLFAAFALGACAARGTAPGRTDVGDAIRERAGATIRTEPGAPGLPQGVSLDDGLTMEEAVAVALWNSPAFEATLTELGLARADLVEAGMLRNPVLSLLFPWGPKQLEWTLQFPAEVLWQRPRRMAMASANARAVGERLVFEGLRLVAETRQAFVDAGAVDLRARLAAENLSLTERIAGIADARLRAGDISELEARAARADAAQGRAAVRALEHEQTLSRIALAYRLGLEPPPPFTLVLDPQTPACAPAEGLLEDAVRARPDVRAAEIVVEAAGQRAKWERSRILTLMATLDANAKGSEGYEMGPGIVAELPILSRNNGPVARAVAELDRASRTYLALRAQVALEVRTASVRMAQAQEAWTIWTREIVPELEIEQRQAERAYQAGEAPLISLLDVGRRLVQARMRSVDSRIELDRAVSGVERSVGRACKS